MAQIFILFLLGLYSVIHHVICTLSATAVMAEITFMFRSIPCLQPSDDYRYFYHIRGETLRNSAGERLLYSFSQAYEIHIFILSYIYLYSNLIILSGIWCLFLVNILPLTENTSICYISAAVCPCITLNFYGIIILFIYVLVKLR